MLQFEGPLAGPAASCSSGSPDLVVSMVAIVVCVRHLHDGVHMAPSTTSHDPVHNRQLTPM